MGSIRSITLIIAAGLCLAACSSQSGSSTTTTGALATVTGSVADAGSSSTLGTIGGPTAAGTVLDVADSNPDLSTFRALAHAAGWDTVLGNPGPYTIFAPTNSAFDAALQHLGKTSDQLFADVDLAAQLLTNHILAGRLPSGTVYTLNAKQVPTMNGTRLAVSVDNSQLFVDDANVIAFDLEAANGVIHIIDQVLIPS